MELPASQDSQDVTETVAVSEPFVGRWGRLVSQTNWEKGKIIAEWREALVASGAAPHEYADEAWSRLVGQVTPQHVGRLRRTYVRFAAQQQSYAGLYWSHFLAALEWEDAELWLEGAVQNDWSVNDMRAKRFETLGGPAAEEFRGFEAGDVDEDAEPIAAGDAATMAEVRAPGDAAEAHDGEHAGPTHDGPDFGDEDATAGDEAAAGVDLDVPFESATPQRPFDGLAELPADLREAFESFKLAILHHKMKEWSEVAADDVVGALRALEQLVGAPS